MCQLKQKTNQKISSLLTGCLLLGSVVGLGGCLPPPGYGEPLSEPLSVAADGSLTTDEASQVTGQTALTATHISSAEAIETSQGVRVALGSNGSLPYQIFALDAPPRLLLTFAGVRLEPAVQPKMVALPGVTGLFPMEGADQTAQMEIVLREMAEYTVRERPDGLDLIILTKGSSATAGADTMGQKRLGLQARRLDSIQVANHSAGTKLYLHGMGPFPEPQVSRLYDPPQIIFDFAGVTGPGVGREMPVASQEIKAVRLASDTQKTRLVVDLTHPDVQSRLEEADGVPVVHLTPGSGRASQQTGRVNATQSGVVEAVQFTQKGAMGLLTIQTGREAVPLDSQREEQTLTLTLKETRLADRLSHNGTGGQRQDVQSFGGAVKTIDTYAEGQDTRIVVALTSPADQHEIIQQGKTILVQIKPATATEGGSAQPLYSGAKVSMDFKGIDIHNALRLLAELNNLNLLVADSVKGTVTMRLVAVPWDQALDLILESKGLGKELQGNVLRVAPLADLQSMADAQWQARESKQKLEPMVTEMIPVSFAKASEIRDLLLETDQRSTPSGAGGSTTTGQGAAAQSGRDASRNPRLLSANGSVVVDQRTNTLIVKDMAVNLAKVRDMVAKLDKPIPQVLIEARIVEVGRDSALGLGINWGFNYKGSVDSNMGISSSVPGAYMVQQDATVQGGRRPAMTGGALTAPNFAMMPAITQMPTWVGSAVSPNLGVHLGSLSPLLDLDIELGALEVDGKAKTISSPRVLTANNKEASISQGVRQPYPTESESGGVTYQYMDAALSLKVTPHVTANGFITLEVTAKNNSIKGSVSPGAPPALNTREVETQALVKDGQTIVLGGIFQNNQADSQRGIPELKEIPFFGWLFKNKVTSNTQTELLVFITPRIVNPS